MELFIMVLASVGGGMFAALIGATNSFIFTGIMEIVGVGVQMAGGGDTFLATIASGPLFGPHISFSAGVAALALTKRLYSEGVAKGLDGKDAFVPLYQYKKILPILLAGLTGALGFLLNDWFVNGLILRIDTIALVIVILNVLTRLLIGRTGLIPKKNDRLNRYKETNENILFNLIWGFGFAAIIAYVTLVTDNALFGFYLSAASLMFMGMGKDIPFSHHISLVTGYAAIQTGNAWIAILFGLLSVPIFEYLQAALNPEADTLMEVSTLTIMLLSIVIFNFL